jgi:hypothetical protein
VVDDFTFVLRERVEEAPNIESASELALGVAEDNCAKANEGVGVIDVASEEAPNTIPVLPELDDTKVPPEETAVPPKPNAGLDAPPNTLPPPGTLPVDPKPIAGVEDVPKEKDVGVLCEEAFNPRKPDIVDSTKLLH